MITNQELADLGFSYEDKGTFSVCTLNVQGIAIEVTSSMMFGHELQLIELVVNRSSINLRKLTYEELKQLINLLKLTNEN